MRPLTLLPLFAAGAFPLAAQAPFSDEARQYIAVDAPAVALTNVKVIDGTGAPAAEGQTILIEGGRIGVVGPTAAVTFPAGTEVLDLPGHTVIPGLVGMHDHTFYYTYVTQRGIQSNHSAPLLYLGSGVTTIRTTGSRSPYAEINLRDAIDRGEVAGPRIYVTGPYVIGPSRNPRLEKMGALLTKSPEDVRRAVAYWAEEGATWIKAYNTISRAYLSAVIDEAHKHGIKVTAHLCSVGYREAVALGIDHLEHGLFANAEYDPAKQPDECPSTYTAALAVLDIGSPEVQATFRDMVANNVGMTSTLAVYECLVPGRPTWDERTLSMLSPRAFWEDSTRNAHVKASAEKSIWPAVHKKAMEYEVAFVRAGGLLTSGVDPAWCTPAGLGDQRQFELLVEAGFTTTEAVQIASANGAKALGDFHRFGSITSGKLADLAVVRGDLEASASEIRNVTLVFKEGIGYDARKLLDAAKGQVGVW